MKRIVAIGLENLRAASLSGAPASDGGTAFKAQSQADAAGARQADGRGSGLSPGKPRQAAAVDAPAAARLELHAGPLVCPKCQGPMSVIALIENPAVLGAILKRLGLWQPEDIPKAIAGMEALAKNGFRYPFPQYGIRQDVRAAMAASYPDRAQAGSRDSSVRACGILVVGIFNKRRIHRWRPSTSVCRTR